MIRPTSSNPIAQKLYQCLTHTGSDFTITYPNTSMSFKKGSTSRYGKTVSAFELYVYKDGNHSSEIERSLLVFIENKGETFYIMKKPRTYKIVNNGDFKGENSNAYQLYLRVGGVSTIYKYDPMPIDCNGNWTIREIELMDDDEYESGDRGI